jgi:hypothetical protein
MNDLKVRKILAVGRATAGDGSCLCIAPAILYIAVSGAGTVFQLFVIAIPTVESLCYNLFPRQLVTSAR